MLNSNRGQKEANPCHLFNELRRRNVFKVGLAYAIIAWLLAQVLQLVFQRFGSPDWVIQSLSVVVVIGLPIALFFAWAFEVTPEGIKRESEVDRSASGNAPRDGGEHRHAERGRGTE